MMRFTGSISAKLDSKGRVFFPSTFRKLLHEVDDRFVLKRDVYQDCLVVYPYGAWEREVAELRARLNRWNPQQALVFRQFMADVEVFSLDVNGRFLVPRRYLKQAAIGQQVVFIGMDDRIEIWDKARAEAPFMLPGDFETALQELMSQQQ